MLDESDMLTFAWTRGGLKQWLRALGTIALLLLVFSLIFSAL